MKSHGLKVYDLFWGINSPPSFQTHIKQQTSLLDGGAGGAKANVQVTPTYRYAGQETLWFI